MFIGEHTHSIDEKGRIAVPAKFRKHFSSGIIVTRGLDSCLFVFTKKEWEKLAAKLAELPLSHSNSRAFSRLMLAGAVDLELDSQGRAVLPEYLRTYASLQKKIVIAGVYSRLELWSETRWKQYKARTEKESDAISEQLSQLGI